jgi:hypothetical protein
MGVKFSPPLGRCPGAADRIPAVGAEPYGAERNLYELIKSCNLIAYADEGVLSRVSLSSTLFRSYSILYFERRIGRSKK